MSKMHQIIVAPDSFKGSITSPNVARIVTKAFKEAGLQYYITELPLADGGEGSIDIIARSLNLRKIDTCVENPLGKKIQTYYYLNNDSKIAYIELAKASGLHLIDTSKNSCMQTSTFGTGVQIRHAIDMGAQQIILFIGGSATNDAATGICNGIGINFLRSNKQQLQPIGANLAKIHEINDDAFILKHKDIDLIVACDVENPFYGINGAAYTYARQKGATIHEIEYLDNGLRRFSFVLKESYGVDVQKIKGSGAAGGVGGGLAVMTNASIVSGTELILDILQFADKLKQADLLITGEGKIDRQTLDGKLIKNLCLIARRYKVPVWAICGYFDGNNELMKSIGLQKIFSLVDNEAEIKNAINRPEKYLYNCAVKMFDKIANSF